MSVARASACCDTFFLKREINEPDFCLLGGFACCFCFICLKCSDWTHLLFLYFFLFGCTDVVYVLAPKAALNSIRVWIWWLTPPSVSSQRPSSEMVRGSLRLLTSSANRLHGECQRAAPADSCPTDAQLVTQQLIQCAYDIAKAAKQLVTVTTKESNWAARLLPSFPFHRTTSPVVTFVFLQHQYYETYFYVIFLFKGIWFIVSVNQILSYNLAMVTCSNLQAVSFFGFFCRSVRAAVLW